MTDLPTESEMQTPKINWNFNASTLLAITLACIGGLYKFTSLESRVDNMDDRGKARIMSTDKNFADINASLDSIKDIPFRMGAQEAGLRNANERMDRLSEALLTGQEQLRKDFNNAVDNIRKDVNAVGTKVEVLGTKLEAAQTNRTAFRP